VAWFSTIPLHPLIKPGSDGGTFCPLALARKPEHDSKNKYAKRKAMDVDFHIDFDPLLSKSLLHLYRSTQRFRRRALRSGRSAKRGWAAHYRAAFYYRRLVIPPVIVIAETIASIM
jgi:hypothetical protein